MTKIYFPEIKKVSNVFSEAKLAEGSPPYDSEWRYLGTPCGFFGGKYFIRTRRKNGEFFCFGHEGSRFLSTWVKPFPYIIEEISRYLISPPGSMEFVKRTDGTSLVILNDDQGIGRRWVAVLDPEETPITLMSPEDQKFWDDEVARKEQVYSLVTDNVVDVARAEEMGVPIRADA